MKCVILAAGRGRRLRPLTDEMPKAFIPMGNSPLLYHSLDYLRSVGITEAIIVVGFMEKHFKQTLGDRYGDLNITYVSNKEYETTGSMYSLSQTERILDDDILLLESDLLYEQRALGELIHHPFPDVIVTTSPSGSGDEVFIYVDENNYLTKLGKNIDKIDTAVELVGICKLSLSFLHELYKKAKEDYEKGEKNYHYEEVIYKLSKSHSIQCHFIKDLLWTEIDKYDDLERARNDIYPKIIDKQR